MKIINWGIIGLGNIAHEFSKAFAKTKNAKLLAIASKDENKLKKFRQQFNVDLKFSFKNYQELIDCDEVDIVYIALPNSLHKQWVLNAIKNKKNILVEKPATINFSEANEIRDHLKKTNIFFSEAFMYRYHPQIQSVIKKLSISVNLYLLRLAFSSKPDKLKRRFSSSKITWGSSPRSANITMV